MDTRAISHDVVVTPHPSVELDAIVTIALVAQVQHLVGHVYVRLSGQTITFKNIFLIIFGKWHYGTLVHHGPV